MSQTAAVGIDGQAPPPAAAEDAALAAGAIGDSLGAGLSVLLAATIGQRLIGLIRNLLFCRYLTPEELGRWNLAFSFLMLAAPLIALGLPGAFGRYVEHYRLRGQLRAFLRNTTLASLALGAAAILCLSLAPRQVAWIVFKDETQLALALASVLALAAVLAFNYLTELLTALREVRAASAMQVVSTVAFTVVGMSLIHLAQAGAAGVVIGYGVASLAAVLIALRPVRRVWRALPAAAAPLAGGQLWGKLAPLALWVWSTDLLSNLFDVADRYMILHLAAADAQAASALVGQYHASRIVPTLMVTLAAMLAHVLLPYLAQDWEQGRRERVSRHVALAIKLASVALVGGSAVFLALAPWIFETALAGKYGAGLDVLPQTLAYCAWACLQLFVLKHLFCAEQGKLGSLAMLAGLVVNIALNLYLAPRFGLPGAVLATAIANAVMLALTCLTAAAFGLRFDRGALAALCLPLALCFGAMPGLCGAAAMIAGARWLLSGEERALLSQGARQVARPLLARAARRNQITP